MTIEIQGTKAIVLTIQNNGLTLYCAQIFNNEGKFITSLNNVLDISTIYDKLYNIHSLSKTIWKEDLGR